MVVISPQENDTYNYLDSVILNASVIDSCGVTNESMNYSFNWKYSDIDNPSYVIGDVEEWIVPSFAFGSANITAIVQHDYFYPINNVTAIDVIRTTSIFDFNVSSVMVKDGLNNITCSVNMVGITNKSGYNVSFYLDQNYTTPYIRTTDFLGVALFEWDTTGYLEGPHNVECNITDDVENYIYASNIYSEYYRIVETIIPTDMNISAYFVDNRELDLYDGSHFISATTVYRNSFAPIYEPDVLYLAANITTLWSSGPKAGQLKNIDNEAGWFIVQFKWKTLNNQWTDSIRHYIRPDETIEFLSIYDTSIGEDTKFTYIFEAEPITKTRTITKYRIEERCN